MIFVAEFKELYDSIKKLINKFKRDLSFDTFTDHLLFVNTFDDDTPVVCRFVTNFYNRYNAIEIYNSTDGLNYLSDSLNLPKKYDRFLELDGIILMLLPSDALTKEDGDYIHSLNYKIKKEDNLLIYKYTYGKGRRKPTIAELESVFENLDYMDSLTKNDFTSLMSAIDNNRIADSFINRETLEYQVSFVRSPDFEYKVKNYKANKKFVEECKNRTYFGEAYLFASYYPLVIRETNVRPLILTYMVPDKMVNIRYITSARSTYKDVIFGLLDDIFDNVGFMPERLLADNGDILSILKKTLDELHIEYDLIVNTFDPIRNKALDDTDLGKKPGLYDDPADIQSKSDIETFLNYMTSTIKNIDYNNLDFKKIELELENAEYEDVDGDYDEFEDDKEEKKNKDTDTDLVA